MVDAAFNSSNSVCHGNGLSAHPGISRFLRTHLFIERQDRYQAEEPHWSSYMEALQMLKFHLKKSRGMGDTREPDDE